MRALLGAVVVMGVLIVAGVVTLAVLLVGRLSSGPAGLASVVLDEPAGTRIAGASVGADRLAVTLQGGGVDRIVVLDTRTGAVVGRVGLAR